jgi:capsular exopolysaccharide synthesis family protein
MELKQYVSTVWKWSWLIVLATIVATVSSYWATSRMPRIYKTTTTLMVGQVIQSDNPTTQDFWTSQQLAGSYVELVRRQPILEATVEALGLNMSWQVLAGQVSASAVAGTQLLQISVEDTDPQRAKILADEIARQLILRSPTPSDMEQEEHRQFVSEQLTDLKAKIGDTEDQIDELEQRMALETSARGIQDTQNQIAALQMKINTWQGNYANLLDFYEGSRTNYLSVVEPASVPTTPVSPRTKVNVLLAASIGFVLAAGAALLLEYLDDTIKTGEDIERVLQTSTLGAIARIHPLNEPSDHLIAKNQPRAPISEAYRVVRTNLQFSSLSNPAATVLVTSASPGEGKTTTAANLAIAMAQAGKRVVLADTDLRRPSIHYFFDASNNQGLTSLLLDEDLELDDVLADSGVEGLRVLTSGPLPPNPAELLGSPQMKQLIQRIREQAEVIIFDSPPILAVADASILGSQCDGALLVVDAGRTRSDVAKRGKETLDKIGVNLLGVVLNKLSRRRGGGYYYYYYYSTEGGREKRSRKKR